MSGRMNCRDCDKPLATNADIDCCHPECDGCAACEAFCWGNFHSGCPTPIDWRERYDRLSAELERWRHGVMIEGDFVCPNELEAVNLRAELDRLNKYIATHDEEYATMKETLRAEHQECQRLRAEVERMRSKLDAAMGVVEGVALADETDAVGELKIFPDGGDARWLRDYADELMAAYTATQDKEHGDE